MTYAHIDNNQITQTGYPPRILFDGERWWDLREVTDEQLAARGWYPIVQTPHPEPIETGTYDSYIELVDGQPTVVWVYRDWRSDELAQQAQLDDLVARIERIEAKLWPVDPEPTPGEIPTAPTLADHGGIWPQDKLLSDGGKVWRNVAHVPLTTPPSGFPGAATQWTHLFVEVEAAPVDPPPPPTYPAWSASAAYAKGDRVTYSGRVWQCEIAHGAKQLGQWKPGVAHTVWKDLGPA